MNNDKNNNEISEENENIEIEINENYVRFWNAKYDLKWVLELKWNYFANILEVWLKKIWDELEKEKIEKLIEILLNETFNLEKIKEKKEIFKKSLPHFYFRHKKRAYFWRYFGVFKYELINLELTLFILHFTICLFDKRDQFTKPFICFGAYSSK